MSEKASAGARFSTADGIVIALCALLSWSLRELPSSIAWLPAVALGHFFLFCNVFRVRRSFELAWATVFLANFTAWSWIGFSWPSVLAVQTPVTVLAIGVEMRSPRYHGIGSARPGAPVWLQRPHSS